MHFYIYFLTCFGVNKNLFVAATELLNIHNKNKTQLYHIFKLLLSKIQFDKVQFKLESVRGRSCEGD